ncbi:RNA-binding ATPase activator esf2 [Friedmanniomyces endolithicus]|nr:RNA-binding ATPase activator esf2 [Friedmanniomyces endolithicus]
MSIRKRNEFLEHGGSDDEGLGNESEDEERRGAKGGRTNKRRKIDAESDDESVHSVNERQEAGVAVLEDHDGEPIDGTTTSAGRFALGADFEEHEQPQSTLDPTAAQTRPKSVLATSHSARVKRGGNKKKSFTDGWVEFTSKTEAKAVAERLNGEILGGKKGGFYRDDMWNVKYLRGFKWTHLTEQIANENAERVARLREEVRRTRKENKAFVEDVERGKMVEGMVRKRMAKDEGKVAVSGTGGRQFLQRKARERNGDEGTERGTGKEVAEQRRVVGKIFA